MATDVDAASTTTLDWDDVPNAAGYDVYFGACPAPDYPSASYQRVTDSELTGQTLTSSTTYCWKVVSAADAGNTCVTDSDCCDGSSCENGICGGGETCADIGEFCNGSGDCCNPQAQCIAQQCALQAPQ